VCIPQRYSKRGEGSITRARPSDLARRRLRITSSPPDIDRAPSSRRWSFRSSSFW